MQKHLYEYLCIFLLYIIEWNFVDSFLFCNLVILSDCFRAFLIEAFWSGREFNPLIHLVLQNLIQEVLIVCNCIFVSVRIIFLTIYSVYNSIGIYTWASPCMDNARLMTASWFFSCELLWLCINFSYILLLWCLSFYFISFS